MKSATREEVMVLVNRFNTNLESGDIPMTLDEMCDIEGIIIVECPHSVICNGCSKLDCEDRI